MQRAHLGRLIRYWMYKCNIMASRLPSVPRYVLVARALAVHLGLKSLLLRDWIRNEHRTCVQSENVVLKFRTTNCNGKKETTKKVAQRRWRIKHKCNFDTLFMRQTKREITFPAKFSGSNKQFALSHSKFWFSDFQIDFDRFEGERKTTANRKLHLAWLNNGFSSFSDQRIAIQ